MTFATSSAVIGVRFVGALVVAPVIVVCISAVSSPIPNTDRQEERLPAGQRDVKIISAGIEKINKHVMERDESSHVMQPNPDIRGDQRADEKTEEDAEDDRMEEQADQRGNGDDEHECSNADDREPGEHAPSSLLAFQTDDGITHRDSRR